MAVVTRWTGGRRNGGTRGMIRRISFHERSVFQRCRYQRTSSRSDMALRSPLAAILPHVFPRLREHGVRFREEAHGASLVLADGHVARGVDHGRAPDPPALP